MSKKAEKAASATEVAAMDLLAYLDEAAPTEFEVPGIAGKLYCKVLGIDEAANVIRAAAEPKANFIAEMCAVAVVDAAGVPRGDAAWWGRFKSKHSAVLVSIFAECKRINGMVSADEVGEVGKPSGETIEPA